MEQRTSPARMIPPEISLADAADYSSISRINYKNTAALKHFHNFKLLRSNLNIAPLMAALNSQPELWDEITARQTTSGSPHRYTRSVFLRWAERQALDAVFNDIPAIDYPALEKLPEAQSLIEEVLRVTGASELGRVLIVALDPQGFIAPHCDEGKYADHFERFHISLESEEGNVFNVEATPGCGEFVHMRPGELWFFNHKGCHTLFNGSAKTRLHLIVDCVAPRFRMERA